MPSLPPETRRAVAVRAGGICLIAEDDAFLGCQVDHIISRKHGGGDELANLAFACAPCNRRKGADIGSVDSAGIFTRLFNPRTDAWREHFQAAGAVIEPLTAIGDVTVRILAFNAPERIAERVPLATQRRFPPRR